MMRQINNKAAIIVKSKALQFMARIMLGGVFIYASLDKIAFPDQFASIVKNYRRRFKVPPQIPGRKSVDGVGSDGVGYAEHALENSPDVSPGFGFNVFFEMFSSASDSKVNNE